MWTRASAAALGAGLAVLALLALPSSPSLAEQASSSPGQSQKEPESTTKKKAPQTRPAQTRPVKKTAPAKTAPASAKKQGKKPLVFTDDDLAKYHTGGEASRSTSVPPSSADPLKPFKDKAEKARWRQARAAEFHNRIVNWEGRLKFLQQKRLAIQNPLLPRPANPSGEPDSDEGLSGEERLAKNDEEIRDTNMRLDAARKELAAFLEANPE